MKDCGEKISSAGNLAPEACDLCGGARFKLVALEAGHQIWRCQACALVQVRPLPLQTAEMNQAYWKVDMDSPAVQKARLGSRSVYNHGLGRMEKTTGISLSGKKVLDVGCGMGTFLEIAKQRGAVPYGIDVSPEAVQFSRKQCGIDTVTVGDFERADFPAGFFHVITGWNVLEHTHSPRRWLAQAYRLLADDGVLLVKVPNVRFSAVASKLTPVLRKLGLPTTSYLATRPPLHLYGFSTATLHRMLAEASFEVLSVERAPVRETAGVQGRMIVALAAVATGLCAGRTNYHPVLMALARKRNLQRKNESP